MTPLERGLAVARAVQMPREDAALVAYALARALWIAHRDHDRALALAEEAAAGAHPDDRPAIAAELARWRGGARAGAAPSQR